MIIKIEWKEHDRVYTIGVIKFLQELGYDVKEDEIKTTLKRILAKDGADRKHT